MDEAMKLNYSLVLAAGGSINNTPSLSAQKLPFYTTACGHFSANQSYFTERQGLENSCLLFYTLGGRGLLRYHDAEAELLPGQAALINCFDYQYYSTASEEPWDFKWVHIGGAVAADYEQRINGNSLNVVALGEPCRTSTALDGVYALLRDREDFLADIKICGLIMEALTELAVARQQPNNDTGLHRHRAELEHALAFVRVNYHRRIGVDDILAGVNISKYYFLRLFKARTGLGLYEFLNNHRVDVAKQLLKSTDRTVGDIAHSVGFPDVNCFIRYFKKVTGATPELFRRYYLY